MHLLGIAFGLDGRGDFEDIFDEVIVVVLRLSGSGALATALFSALPTPPGHKAPNGPQRFSSCGEFERSMQLAIGGHSERQTCRNDAFMTMPIAQRAVPVNDCRGSTATLRASLPNGHIPLGSEGLRLRQKRS